MKIRIALWLVIAAMAQLLAVAHADPREEAEKAEVARQAAFRSGMEAIVGELNAGSFRGFLAAIDKADMLERIFALRLIDPKVKKSFSESYEYSLESIIKSGFDVPDSGMRATLLGVESRNDRGRAVVRFDEDNFTFRYHEYDLRLNKAGKVVIVDWIDFLSSDRFTDSVGLYLVSGAPSQPAMRKLVDIPNPTDREMFQFAELLKAARDVSLDRYLKIRDDMSERFRKQRVVVVTTAQLARTVRQRRKMIAAVEILANTYPDEPRYSLMLLDYYFPSRKYEEAMQALQRLSKRLGVDDAAMDARFSATALVLGNTADALAYAEKATEREPGLELGWWSSLQVRAEMSDFAGATEVLKTLQDDFGYDMSPEFLQRDRSYAQLLASGDYKRWRESIK